VKAFDDLLTEFFAPLVGGAKACGDRPSSATPLCLASPCWLLLFRPCSLTADFLRAAVWYEGPDVEKIIGAYKEALTAQRQMLVIAVRFPPCSHRQASYAREANQLGRMLTAGDQSVVRSRPSHGNLSVVFSPLTLTLLLLSVRLDLVALRAGEQQEAGRGQTARFAQAHRRSHGKDREPQRPAQQAIQPLGHGCRGRGVPAVGVH